MNGVGGEVNEERYEETRKKGRLGVGRVREEKERERGGER